MKEETAYSDIVESKIEEWKNKIDMLRKRAQKAPASDQNQLDLKIKQLHSAVETATLQLRDLDSHENRNNTVAIKDEILKIFEAIDKDLPNPDETSPFML